MGRSVNKVILIGHLGADPSVRYTGSGRAVCQLSLATNRRIRKEDNSVVEQVDWHRVSAWGKQGELCQTYLRKGAQVYVEGRLRHSNYLDKDGQRRFSVEVVSDQIVFLSSKTAESNGATADELPF